VVGRALALLLLRPAGIAIVTGAMVTGMTTSWAAVLGLVFSHQWADPEGMV
jgi:hypothetical protein